MTLMAFCRELAAKDRLGFGRENHGFSSAKDVL